MIMGLDFYLLILWRVCYSRLAILHYPRYYFDVFEFASYINVSEGYIGIVGGIICGFVAIADLRVSARDYDLAIDCGRHWEDISELTKAQGWDLLWGTVTYFRNQTREDLLRATSKPLELYYDRLSGELLAPYPSGWYV